MSLLSIVWVCCLVLLWAVIVGSYRRSTRPGPTPEQLKASALRAEKEQR
jgi:hypothetical protein